MESENRAAKKHNIRMENREKIFLTGIEDVLSFDAEEILLKTAEGKLLMCGRNLHVGRLSLESGEVDVEGKVTSLIYQEPKAGKEGGFWGRMLR